VQAPARLVRFGELHEELVEQWVVDDLLRALTKVNYLLDKTLLDGHHTVILDLARVIAEQPMHYQIEQ